MKTYNEWVKTEKTKTITVVCRDDDNKLTNLLNYIKKIGNVGHSFSIIVDPNDEAQRFDWDGDGSDAIYEIKCD